MKKSTLWLLIISVVVLLVGIGYTLAYIIALSNNVENTFTVGNVEITLTETTGSEYKLTPGVILQKDPTITVKQGSDDCWVFVEVKQDSKLKDFCDFEIDSGWTRLDNYDGVYYQRVTKSKNDVTLNVIKYCQVSVKDTVTEEQLNTIGNSLNLDFTAGAIQNYGFDSPQDAWNTLNS